MYRRISLALILLVRDDSVVLRYVSKRILRAKMPKQEILEMCEKAIRRDLGSLDDLPDELANTVANVYYKLFNSAIDVIKGKANNPGWIPDEVLTEENVKKGTISFIENTARHITQVKAVPDFIKGLRKIDRHNKPKLYQYAVDFTLDCLKFDIKDAHKKTGLRRMIERKVKKNEVQEIPNLIDLLDGYQKRET